MVMVTEISFSKVQDVKREGGQCGGLIMMWRVKETDATPGSEPKRPLKPETESINHFITTKHYIVLPVITIKDFTERIVLGSVFYICIIEGCHLFRSHSECCRQ